MQAAKKKRRSVNVGEKLPGWLVAAGCLLSSPVRSQSACSRTQTPRSGLAAMKATKAKRLLWWGTSGAPKVGGRSANAPIACLLLTYEHRGRLLRSKSLSLMFLHFYPDSVGSGGVRPGAGSVSAAGLIMLRGSWAPTTTTSTPTNK